MTKLYTSLFFFLFAFNASAQQLTQYFDGNDTSALNSIFVILDSNTNNIWQIGPPQKTLLHSAATTPNALVTDTLNTYPVNDTSSFTFKLHKNWWGWGILAIRWKQKIDVDFKKDAAIIEYSMDSAKTWNNVFDDPRVYNFYGFDTLNVDTVNGELAFTGTDTTWRDIWLCFDQSFVNLTDTVFFRFTIKSDSIDSNKEGWMIDNMLAHITWIHTIKKTEENEYMKVYPTNTTGRVYIEAEKLQEFHIIESMQLINTQGRVVQQYGKSPTKYFIDINHHPNGHYYLKVNTNKRSQTFPVILNR